MTNYTSKSPTNQRLELIQELNNLLVTATQAAGEPLGAELVSSLLKPLSEDGNQSVTQSTRITNMLDEIEKAGIDLSPGLVMKLNSSPSQMIRDALTIYLKVYEKEGVNNPTGLFYKILDNLIKPKS